MGKKIPTGGKILNIAALSYLSGFFIILFFGQYQLYYGFGWILLSLGFLALLHSLSSRKAFVTSISGKYNRNTILLLLFVSSLLVRLIFISKNPHLSLDVYGYNLSANLLHSAQPPFTGSRGFAYAPLSYFFFTLVYAVSPSIYALKLFFILVDSLIPLALFFTAREFLGETQSMVASIAYVINPLSIAEVGWSGHCDSLPSLLLVVSFFYLLKKRYYLSCLFFSVATMTKWYPLFLLPIYLSVVYKGKGLRASLSFSLVFLFIFLLCFSLLTVWFPTEFPLALKAFLKSGGNVSLSRSISQLIPRVVGLIGFNLPNFPVVISYLVYCYAISVSLAYAVKIGFKKFAYSSVILLFSIQACTSIFLNLGGLFLQYGEVPPLQRLYQMFFSILVLVPIYLLFKHIRHFPRKDTLSLDESISLVILLVIIGQPAFAPWYFIWALPFLLSLSERRISFYWVMMLLFSQPTAYQSIYNHFTSFMPGL